MADGDIFDADAKYAREPDFRIPAAVDAELLAELESAALATFHAVGARGLARVDFFATDGGLLLNEVNTFPGFTPMSQYPLIWESAGVQLPELLTTLIDTALVTTRSTTIRPPVGKLSS